MNFKIGRFFFNILIYSYIFNILIHIFVKTEIHVIQLTDQRRIQRGYDTGCYSAPVILILKSLVEGFPAAAMNTKQMVL